MTPESRKDHLLAQPIGDELVIYDQRTHQSHRLNRTAAHVWWLADGSRSLPDLAASLRKWLVIDAKPVQVEESEELVRHALDELDQEGLLVRGPN